MTQAAPTARGVWRVITRMNRAAATAAIWMVTRPISVVTACDAANRPSIIATQKREKITEACFSSNPAFFK